MRYIYFLLIAFIFAACGNQKIRFVRTHTEKQKVIDVSELPSTKKSLESTFSKELVPENSTSERSTGTKTEAIDKSDEKRDEPLAFSETNDSSFPETVEDSVKVSTEDAAEIADEALRAQKNGTLSLIFAILMFLFQFTAIALLIISFGEFEIAILAAIVGIFSVASLVLSIILGIKSLRARYNTRLGRRRAIIGLVISGLPLLYMLIALVASLF